MTDQVSITDAMVYVMTKKQCIIACTTSNLLFIVAQIYKHTQFVHYTYQKQQAEHALAMHEETIKALTQQLYALKDRIAIKEFAQTQLSMKPIALHQIKRLSL
jgi:hypothetical protein